MKQILSRPLMYYGALLLCVVAAGFFFILQPTASNAVSSYTVGTITAEFRPYPPAPGLEDLKLSYVGAGELDLSGYSVHNAVGEVFKIDTLVLQSGESKTFCSTNNTVIICDQVWAGDQWEDVAGTFKLTDAAGAVVISQNYSDVTESSIVRLQKELVAEVYSRNDAVPVCHTKDGVQFSLKKDRMWKVAAGEGGHSTHSEDIIPPFYYTLDAGTAYFGGHNWESGQAIYEASCAPNN